MNASTGILAAAGAAPTGDAIGTIAGGAMLLLIGLAVLVVGDSRPSRLGAVGLMLWGACLVVPIAAGLA
jgi:hypothetical protein